MNYPPWAPTELVDLLQRRQKAHAAPKSEYAKPRDVEAELRRLQEKTIPGMSEENVEKTRHRLWRNSLSCLPRKGDKLLERLLTCQQMKGVWEALAKRATCKRLCR